jgi:hypothetical protein
MSDELTALRELLNKAEIEIFNDDGCVEVSWTLKELDANRLMELTKRSGGNRQSGESR